MDEAPVSLDPKQEIRFAVVMYGGVSLAIYMNGVAQEMLRLVRATSPAEGGERGQPQVARRCGGTEAVYQKLGRMLRRGEEPLKKSQVENGEATPVSTSFVIDVISGTSAGGINGIFLAKALANDQNMEDLKNLWVEEGDFGKLMNDSWRLPGAPPRTRSLLDGKHMYRKLLEAFEGMEKTKGSDDSEENPSAASPYVRELDLFVTATDISGLTLPLQFADGVVKERRHRNTFHFVYSTTPDEQGRMRNDFTRRFNPFLAFAARCTSSFPVAFEPMRLADIDEVVPTVEPYARKKKPELSDYLSTSKYWRRFFEDYLKTENGKTENERIADEARAAGAFARRSFGDGGYLDNKPFSYAIDTLLRRRADLPVDRKLFFVDPDPQNPEDAPDFDHDVDLLENTLSALSPTVSTETIREDIQRVLDRNRLVERIEHVTRDVERDIQEWSKIVEETKRSVEAATAPTPTPKTDKPLIDDQKEPKKGEEWSRLDVNDMIRLKGLSYGGYHRLKVAAVTNDLTEIVVAAANFRYDSDEFFAVRHFVEAWRSERFVTYKNLGPNTEFRFLADFDLEYRLRRVGFVRSKINELTGLGYEQLSKKLKGRTSMPDLPAADSPTADAFKQDFREAMRAAQLNLSSAHDILLTVRNRCRRLGTGNWLHEHVMKTGLNEQILSSLLSGQEDDKRSAARQYLMNNPTAWEVFDQIADELKKLLRLLFDGASATCVECLDPTKVTPGSDGARAAYELLWHYYKRFEDYDMVIFPITYATDVGEAVPVDVLRVSPYDADSLINEKEEELKARAGGAARRKLAGTALGHFGAFLDPVWRKNDIMWGRLDAAERIIKTLLPEGDDRDQLIEEAHLAILGEELLPGPRDNLRKLFVSALAEAGARRTSASPPPAIDAVLNELAEGRLSNDAVKAVLDSCVEPGGLLYYFKGREKDGSPVGGYEVKRDPDPKVLVELMARSTAVFGRMLEGLAEKHGMEKKRVAWVTRLGRIFWGLVEVAVPGGYRNLFMRHALNLLYLFSFLLILLGSVLVYAEMLQFGLLTLALTTAMHVAVTLLGDYMRGGRITWRLLLVLVCVGAAIPLFLLALFGGYELYVRATHLNASQFTASLWKWFWELPRLFAAMVAVGFAEMAALFVVVAYGFAKQMLSAIREQMRKLPGTSWQRKTAQATLGEPDATPGA